MTIKIEIPKRLIFLDFDGVLTSYEEGSYITHSEDAYGPSKTICENVKKFCLETGTSIILSTNWRRFPIDGTWKFGTQLYKNPISKVYDIFGNLIVGTLPPIRHVTKSEALITWIEDNDFDYKNNWWYIIDDDPTENLRTTHDYDICNHYVETRSDLGLTEEILKHLREKSENL